MSEWEKMTVDLAYAVRRAVRPHLGAQSSKQSAGMTKSGDVEFVVDEIAEHAIEDFIRKHELSIAYYSEGRGLVTCGNPEILLVIDPIDGTRPAMVGLEGAVVSIAVVPYSRNALLSDITFGCVLELKDDRLYTAGGGIARIKENGKDRPVDLTLNTDIDTMSWSFDIAGRPTKLVADVIAPFMDRSSIRGGVFVFNGIAFSLTRLISGQLDASVDVSNRIFRDHPEFRGEFERAGLGRPIGLNPYDIAASVFIVETAGCTVTDAYGKSLGDTPLLDTSEESIRSLLAASNPVLHGKLLEEINQRIIDMRAC